MDVLLLSRVQFGVSLGLHYLFPVTTLGLALLILVCETLSLFGKAGPYRQVSIFLVKVLGLVFTAGVATGLVLPFQLGANWSRFSLFAGPVFGPMLSVEATAAFALESAFMAVLLFGRKKISPLGLWLSAACVFAGSHFSAFLIVAANSWMQTPAGYVLENGNVVLTSLFAAVWNPSTLIRFMHVVTAAWLTGAVGACSLAAYYAARKKNMEFAAAVFKVAMPLMLVTALAQPHLGHRHIKNMMSHNPEKEAAYEGVFETTNGASLYVFGLPDQERRTICLGVRVPHGLSFLQSGRPHSRVQGLNEFPEDAWPPVAAMFISFRLMVLAGIVLIGAGAVGTYLLWRKRLMSARRYLLLLPWLLPIPYLANELGWIGTEVGRQPWVIYKLVRTAAGSSAGLPAWQVGVSLAGITLIYLALCLLTLVFIRRMIRQGPSPD
jgi:cytochrome d ubiquinol oxidase subunit I